MASAAGKQVLVIGAGSIGERHLRCFAATGRARVSFVEVKPDVRSNIASRYADATAFESIEAALGSGVDAAVIATPAPLHVPQAMHLVGRGVHVLIEKPLSTTTDGVDRLRALAKEKGVTVGVAYVYRAHPALIAMRDAVRSGRFGAPVELVAICGQHFPLYRPAYAQTYYTKHETGGGAVQDALTHVINAGEWIVGPIDRVVADVGHQVLAGAADVEDTAHVLARHGRVLANYSLNQHQAPNETTITVICERGTVRFEHHANRWRNMTTPGGEWTDHADQPVERDTLFVRQASAFLDAIEAGSTPACTLEEAAKTLRVNLAILASARDGAWLNIGA
jgi:predicted dehydrogenase